MEQFAAAVGLQNLLPRCERIRCASFYAGVGVGIEDRENGTYLIEIDGDELAVTAQPPFGSARRAAIDLEIEPRRAPGRPRYTAAMAAKDEARGYALHDAY